MTAFCFVKKSTGSQTDKCHERRKKKSYSRKETDTEVHQNKRHERPDGQFYPQKKSKVITDAIFLRLFLSTRDIDRHE